MLKKTERFQLDCGMEEKQLIHSEAIKRAAAYLRQGKLVAFPTETVYGLGAIATSRDSVAQIYEAKGRPSDNPLIIHIGKKEQLAKWVRRFPENPFLLGAWWRARYPGSCGRLPALHPAAVQ